MKNNTYYNARDGDNTVSGTYVKPHIKENTT